MEKCLWDDACHAHRAPDHCLTASKLITFHRRADGVDYYYVYNRGSNANSGIQPGWGYGAERETPYGAVQATVAFRSEGTAYRMDAWTGDVEPIAGAVRRGDRVEIPIALEGNESTIIAFDRKGSFKGVKAVTDKAYTGEVISLKNWTLEAECWGPGAEADTPSKEIVRVELDGLKPWTQIPELSHASGIGHYSTEVEIKKGVGAVLDLGQVNYSWRVYVNGVEVPASQINSKVDISSQLRKGRNSIEVVVATTLNNRIKAMTPPAPQGQGGPGGMRGRGGRTDDPYGLLGTDGSVLLELYRSRK